MTARPHNPNGDGRILRRLTYRVADPTLPGTLALPTLDVVDLDDVARTGLTLPKASGDDPEVVPTAKQVTSDIRDRAADFIFWRERCQLRRRSKGRLYAPPVPVAIAAQMPDRLAKEISATTMHEGYRS